ncbi:ricin b lectin : Putative integron gene cassette protein OS=uncultured bacterium GN=ORF1 PE=4 SV=1: RicinB_lectin_2 [Gemmata massiliana]|uniref:Ricin B lectin domain-containing protein n=1 Tax=Gemmata massiliana TaxID=1210884 RepID=A0A6P2CR15_9BACT|nr:RICIN domain-containing protein [Gemmata massiliana]VTR91421.1 ricin b lectin : Putative integron gene cassette protein OS=uncultured bacterium GN=ORF1 PE=4 SV=1: RicinB_lectin_2 [Gemmata massiliana]
MFRALATLAACALLTAPVAADDKFVRLVNVDSGKVLSVKDNSEEASARAVLAKLEDDNKAQQWKLVKDGTHLKLVNRKSGKVLDVNDDSKEEGGDIIIWDDKDEGTDNQRWAWAGDGKERQLKSKSSGLVLDVDGEGQLIQKKADEKSKKQLWRVEEVK